ncbi:MAG TPA: HAMP domain-containing protein [Caldilineae bacterium]|nr:HAMP domain-containing protein [Caldilineae bacterium]
MRSLTLKLTLAFLIIGLTGAVLTALFVGFRTRSEFDRFVLDRYQADLVADLASFYEEYGAWSDLEAVLLRNPNRRRRPEFLRVPVVVADADGIVQFGGKSHRPGERLTESNLKRAVPIQVDGETVGWLWAPFLLQQAPMISPRLRPETVFLARVNQAIFFGALGAAVIALLLGILLARTISRPVRKLTEATQRIAQGELGLQVEVRSEDELGELGRSFNQMSSDLARSSELRRQMTADIAHDLRTPLSVILGYTEALADDKLQGTPEIYGVMHEEARHLQHLIDDLRTLSLVDAGELSLQRQPTAPRELLERTAATYASKARSKHITLSVEADADLPTINVDPDRMAQVLNNLVSNALRFTPEGGAITLGAKSDGGMVTLSVQDNGAGIAQADLSNIFARFYRGDETRNVEDGESGLGLAIAKSLVEAHGGTISVESRLGTGTTFTIALL